MPPALSPLPSRSLFFTHAPCASLQEMPDERCHKTFYPKGARPAPSLSPPPLVAPLPTPFALPIVTSLPHSPLPITYYLKRASASSGMPRRHQYPERYRTSGIANDDFFFFLLSYLSSKCRVKVLLLLMIFFLYNYCRI